MSANWLTVAAQQALSLIPILSEANGMDERPLVSDSKQRVALELMQIIVDREHKTKIEKPDARTYYLTLYSQCLRVVSGEAAENPPAES
ncbi:MAG TPA: hypothetical protein VKA60_00070 [Blastocatellia bacterium]|nr:hypothetical protein [Blastocatellia bacterium]